MSPDPSSSLQSDLTRVRLAHRAGVTYATSSLEKTTYFTSPAFIAGLSVTFRTGTAHALERGAIIKQVTALHVVLSRTAPSASVAQTSVSTQIAILRRLLLNGEPDDTETGYWFKRAAQVGKTTRWRIP